MNIFEFRDRLIDDYASYIKSFIQIRDPHIHSFVQRQLQQGMLSGLTPSFNSTRHLRQENRSMNWWQKVRCIGNVGESFVKTNRKMMVRVAH